MSERDLLVAYLMIGAVAGVWWYRSTEETGSPPAERALDALVVGLLWLPFLVILYTLRYIAGAR